MNNSRIIVSLDYPDGAPALALAEQLDSQKCRLKVGKELFTAAGPAFIEKLVERDFDVFLDLKYHDIPNTVARACAVATEMGVWMLNVHASGGREMLLAAREAVDQGDNQPLLIAVTVLTSLGTLELAEVGVESGVDEQVKRLATLTGAAGLDGVVCSAREVTELRNLMGSEFKLVTPGIRPAGSKTDDQKRITTPSDAISMGSDYLVIGRPVTAAPDPLEALLAIEAEIEPVTSR